MKKLLNIIMALGAIGLTATPANASNSNYGTVSGLFAGGNGAVMFFSDGVRTAPPACGAPNGNRWAIDASTVAGQGAIAILLNAYNRGKKVYVMGTGSCSIWGDTETIMFIYVQD